ncbi:MULTISPECIES: D-alanyl-D-alanine carboxypeptidase/D-alanyl-D-alanine-endopeptidase [unclassified Synechococcus]|uniref:D-alanyl-D-alanine carboxypeptidase/D-alanyl-D-alanine endopeptidase n=1 Tax=unclassified Synechococcus TaxID=2626047 RepID=UPI0021A8FF8A|nr:MULTISPECIES: D-alanyl-D-alanine carboxypeptidase/D-alanyl-D-alanine-endopeptidase [unclassified Synechococcus]MCT0214433.1 D-alanyl-D-alanine carboxypeptidase/D-alanyl-D-alanine-endopeptidase [Synechococcus sp. CS-1326]MCT0233264.1 D-alanyl-D-alanine carboxypeptidase/D-alanyl-D-alanine-endopeptidase [Synechococcus sp. CS-1327]
MTCFTDRSISLALGLSLGLLPTGSLLAMPVASLPTAPPRIGLPQLQGQVSCPALQSRVARILGGAAGVWSVSIADGDGRLLADVNGLRPRVPASNQKLISTAFALDRLGPDYRLRTKLWRLPDGTLRLTGEGDPDLALPQLQRFAKLALGSGGGPGQPSSLVRLELAEEPAQAWWPSGWHPGDRSEAYGAPITRLAVTSNAIEMAVANPPGRLQRLLGRELSRQGGDPSKLVVVSAQSPLPQGALLLHEEPSAPMHNLLSLANSESHNFTAEVLLRQAAGSWNLSTSRGAGLQWLSQQGLPMQGVVLMDGSGLDRSNRLTSRFLAALLLRMAAHPYATNYLASMSVAGKRGTLRNLYKGTSLDGRLHAKTGTLTGVRSISGILETSDGPRYVSLISNGAGSPNTTIGEVLRQVQIVSLCQPPA